MEVCKALALTMSPERLTGQESTSISREFLRQHLYLAEQAAVGGLPVVPGEGWAFHYSADPSARAAALQGLLDGTIAPTQAAAALKPNGLIYDARELEAKDLSTMLAKVADITAKVNYYDYERYAQFIANMHGSGIDTQTADAIYDRVAQSRIRKVLLDAYGYTGRQQITEAMRQETTQVMANFPSLPSGEKIFEALKLNWVTQDLGSIPAAGSAETIAQLSEGEKEVFNTLQEAYRQFVQSGTAESFDKLTAAVKSVFEKPLEQEEVQESAEETEAGKEEDQGEDEGEGEGKGQGQGEGGEGGPGGKEQMQDLTKDLDKVKNKVGPPQSPKDPAIPPDDKDEYKTNKEKSSEGVYFYVTPSGTSTAPLLGYYAAGRKSYYDVATKTWSKKKIITPYKTVILGSERQTITSAARISSGSLKALPIPNGYALDASSLKFQGSKKPPELFRDQNGCFYIKAAGACTFSVDLLKEPTLFTNPPIPEDIKPMYSGQLSAQTESFMSALTGLNMERALAVQRYIKTNHVYPAEGNLEVAQALQYKLRQASPNAYIQLIDTSKYLECYSTHNLFIAMMRKMGVPTRLVIGDHVDKVKNGKSQLDSTTGHAWAEVWDGAKWIRIDATPLPEHKPEQKQDEQQEPGQQADDNGAAEPGEPGEDGQSSEGEGQPGAPGKPGQTGKPGPPDMKFQAQTKETEASDQQMQAGQHNLQQAQETMKQIQQRKDQLDQQANAADSFKKLEELRKQAEQADIFEEMKKELEDKIKALEQDKKNKLKEELESMAQDGFVEEEQMQKLLDQIDSGQTSDLDTVSKRVEAEGALHSEYLKIRERVADKVEEKFEILMSILPTEQSIDIDEDMLRRKGMLNRRAMMKPINLIMGTVKNPRVFEEVIKPLFLAGIAVDFSRSVMTMSPEKRRATEDLLVFVLELFDRVVQTHGYMKYALTAFHDQVIPIKGYSQDYNSLEKYAYPDGTRATVKARLMKAMRTEGGTYILPALQYCAAGLNQEAVNSPDYMSSFYFIGDGEDSHSDPRFGGNPKYYLKIKRFVDSINPQTGFGDHFRRAIFLGSEEEKKQLSSIFGEENTFVCSDFDQLVDMFLDGLAADVQQYMQGKI